MTTIEQTTVNQLKLNQAVMGADLKNLTDDVTEMKSDIKEIKAILVQSNDLYVSKKIVKYFVGLAISVTVLALAIYDHFHKAIK